MRRDDGRLTNAHLLSSAEPIFFRNLCAATSLTSAQIAHLRTLMTTDEELDQAKHLLKDYEAGDHSIPEEDLWKAKKSTNTAQSSESSWSARRLSLCHISVSFMRSHFHLSDNRQSS